MRIAMLVQNDWKHDSRVVREAECLARNGHDVTVFCRRMNCERCEEVHNCVTYRVIPHRWTGAAPVDLFWLLLIHIRILAYDVLRSTRQGQWGEATQAMARIVYAGACTALIFAAGLLLLPMLALQHACGGRRWIGRGVNALVARARKLLAEMSQPLPYLNDFAYQGLDDVLSAKPGIVHAHDLVTLSAGFLAARRLGCPLIYDAHELETHTNYHSLGRSTKYWIARYEANLAQWADAIITVCDSIADWIAREYGVARPCVILNVPAHLRRVGADAPAQDGLRTRLGLDPDVPLAVYVGSVTVDRGLDLCVRAIAHLPHAHFAMVGPRYEKTAAEVRATAQELGMNHRVHFVDPVPSAEVVEFISSADCSVIAIQNVCLSYYFCFPNKLLESVMAGLPIAAAALFELRKFVEQHRVGLVMNEKNPVSIADALRTLLADSGRFKPSPDELDWIIARYGWPAQERTLVQLYDRLAAAEAHGMQR